MKRILILGMFILLSVACANAQQTKNAPAAAKKEHVFKGTVKKIEPDGKKFVVEGENVEGWMGAMTMSYAPDKEDVLKKVKVGDQITAKVYDGDFVILHDVQVVAPKPAQDNKASKAPAKK